MADDDVRLLFADTMLGPLGALRPKAGESARDLFDQVRVLWQMRGCEAIMASDHCEMFGDNHGR